MLTISGGSGCGRLRRTIVITAAVTTMLVAPGLSSGQSGDEGLVIRRSRASGLASFVTGVDGEPISVKPASGRAEVVPMDFMAQHGLLFGVTDPARQLTLARSRTDSIGRIHTTYQQIHERIPVFSGVLKVHQNEGGGVTAANGDFYVIPPDLDVTPRLTADEAVDIAIALLAENRGDIGHPIAERAELVIVDPGWYGDPPVGAHLAYYIIVSDTVAALREALFVNARTGEPIDRWTLRQDARNRRIYSGFGGSSLPGVSVRNEGESATGIYDADAAYDYAGDTYDFYYRGFGRDSIDDAGMDIIVTVDSTYPTCPNAYWIGTQAVFCAGIVTDDILAHELTHGVTDHTADLIYQNQPGQLNESFSDVFGELVDLYNGDAAFVGPSGGLPWPPHGTGPGTDTPNNLRTTCDSGARWMVGEDSSGFGGAIRDMWDPTCGGDPDRAYSPLQTCNPLDNGGVHSGSGIPNHAFAIVTDGKTFNGYTVSPIGPIKAGAIWYRALTTYLTPASDFEDAVYAFVQAGSDLIGTAPDDPRTGAPSDSPITHDDIVQLHIALRAVEMDTPGACGSGDRTMTPEAMLPCPFRTTVFADGFEGGTGGWTVFNSGPPTPYDWGLTTTLLPFGRSGVAWFCEDRDIGDCGGQDESGTHSLQSPPIVLPVDADFPRLSFTHYIRAEGRNDGGNVKTRVDGGLWQLIPRTAFEWNPYNARLDSADPQGNTNPLAGESAWSGAGGQWGTSIVNLDGIAGPGDTIELLFEFGKNGCTGLTGWYVDNVEVYHCPDCNEDGTADYREYRYTYSSPSLFPIGTGSAQTVHLFSLPRAGSDVTMSFNGVGDFSGGPEQIKVHINYLNAGAAFAYGAADCPSIPESDRFVVDAYSFNLNTPGGTAVIELETSSAVDPTMCNGESFVAFFLDYHITQTPAPEPDGADKNRYLSFVPGNAGRQTALRVTLAELPPPLDVHDGQVRWVGNPFEVSELSGVSGPTPPTFATAMLICEPVLRDWSDVDVLHVFGDAIVPGAVYQVHIIEETCGVLVEETDAPALTLTTGKWADVTEPYATVGGPVQPDIADVTVIIDKFKNSPGAPIKAMVDIYPDTPDGIIDIVDATFALDAFKGTAYPFDGPTPCP